MWMVTSSTPRFLAISPANKLCSSFLQQIYIDPRTPKRFVTYIGAEMSIKAYMETPNSISSFTSKVIGSLPVLGLVARILSDEGGVGGDIVDFAEFRRRVGKKCTIMDSKAFYEFKDRRGRPGDPLYVLLCCWLTAVGAGFVKSEEILEVAARLRLSNDIEFEEENYISLVKEARERRARLKAPTPSVPMETRVEKALEAICICCFGKDPIEEEDERLLRTMLVAVFPSVKQKEVEKMVRERAEKVMINIADASTDPKPLPSQDVEMQMKDLQFLKRASESSQ